MAIDTYKNPFEVNDFSGGLTDNVYLQDQKRAAALENLQIVSDKSLLSRPGSVVDDLVNPQIPAGIQRVGAIINYNNNDKLFIQSAKKVYYRNPSAYTTLQGTTGNDVFSIGLVTNNISFTQWNGHLYMTNDGFARPMKIYKDSSNLYQVRNQGLPFLSSDPSVVVGGAGSNDYIYSFHLVFTYTVGSVTFQDFGPVTQVFVTGSDDPGTTPNAISSIPVLSNGAIDNYDTATIQIFIYRTLAGGTQSYKIGAVTNGTTTFSDTFADADIQNNDLLYIDDGTLDFEQPPLHKYNHVVNNTGYAAHIKEGSEVRKNTVRQSVPGDPDSMPSAFDIEVEDEINGMSSARSNPLILCRRHIYRVDGSYDQYGRNFPNPIRISDTAGCVSHLSIVSVDIGDGTGGIFWFGNDGVYYSDSYETLKVSDGNNARYKSLLANISDAKRIYGRYDEKERRIFWCVESDSGNLDCDSFAILELRYGISADMPFDLWGGNSFRPTSLEFFNGQLYRGDSRGYVFIHDDSYNSDPKVNTAVAPSLWNKETIIWRYKSVNYNFGSTHIRKYVPKMLLTAANIGDTTIQINGINDAGKKVRELKIVRWRRNLTWGDPNFVWGNPLCVWNSVGILEQWRRFPAKGLRVSYLQIEITNGFSIIVNSDLYGTSTFNGAANTITLDDAANKDWPEDSVDYVIRTEVDDYEREFVVSSRTNDVLTVLDPDGQLPTGSYKWELWGYKKGEKLNLLSYDIHWTPVSQSQMTFESGQDGGNT